MAWPRFVGKLFVIISIVWLNNANVAQSGFWDKMANAGGSSGDWNTVTRGIEQEKLRQRKENPNSFYTTVTTDGLCELNDENKKKLADMAIQKLINAFNALTTYNKLLQDNFIKESGSCHYLYSKNEKNENYFTTDSLPFTETAKAGAKVVTDLHKTSPTATDLVERFNSGENSGNQDMLRWDVRKLMRRNSHADRNSAGLIQWARTAPKGSVFKIDEATSELLENTFGYKVDCIYALMTDDGGSFQCVQGTSDVDVEKLQKQNQKWLEEGKDISAFSFTVAFSCTHDNCSNGKGPLQEQIDKMWDKVDACQADLEKMAKQRDDLIAKRKEAHNLLDVLSGNLEVHCTCATKEVDGKQEKTEEIKKCSAINPDFIEDNMSNCPTIEEYREKMTGVNGESCIICQLFQTILRAVQDIAQKSYNALAPALSGLVGLGFGIYIAYITLLAVATPAAQKISQYLTNLTIQGFKVAIAIILLSAPHFVYGTLIGPLIEGGVDFGISLSREDEVKIKNYGSNFEFKSENTYLQAQVLQNTVGAAVAFNESAALVPAIGRSLICNSWNDTSLRELTSIFGNRFWMRVQMWLEGIILYLFGLAIAFAVGFYMLDCALQLGVVCAMMPFFVASWPFKITKGYTKQGWDIFLNTFFNFVVMGIVISAGSQIMIQALATGLTEETLSSALNSGDANVVMETIDFGGIQMVMLIICCLIALKISGEVQNITNKLSGGLNIGIGSGIGGVAGSSALKAATAVSISAAVAAKATAGAKGKNESDGDAKNSKPDKDDKSESKNDESINSETENEENSAETPPENEEQKV